jgi:hypothetical protein
MDKYNTVMEKAGGGAAPGESHITTPTKGKEVDTPAMGSTSTAVDVSDAPPAKPATPGRLNLPTAHASGAAGATAAAPPSKAPTPGKLNIPSLCSGSSAGSATGGPSSQSAKGTPRGDVHARHRVASVDGDKELQALFRSFDVNGDGAVDVHELSAVMQKLGLSVTQGRIDAMINEVDADGSGTISYEEFVTVVDRFKATGARKKSAFEEVITKQRGAVIQQKAGNVVHSFAQEECAAFVDFINAKLGSDPKLAYLLPFKDLGELFSGCTDGVILCRMINVAEPETVDERVINISPPNRFLITENLNLALNAAKSIGCTVVNIGPGDLMEGRPHLVLGLVWQIVKKALLSKINLKANPNLIRLLQPDETLESLLKLPPEKLLLRWFNYHLEQAGSSRRVKNFGGDLHDSELYGHLMQQIDPEKKANAAALSRTSDLHERASTVVSHGHRMGAEFRIQPSDIVKGNEKLNLGFVAALFNACPGLAPPDESHRGLLDELPEEDEGDSREERAFRMWINSLGMADVFCEHLFDDVQDGVLILQLMDHLRPGVVDWARVNKPPFKMVFKKIENLNYAVALGLDPFHFSLVGVQGKDIVDGNKMLTLALVWQLMHINLLAFLASVRQHGGGSDDVMVKWANEQVKASGAASTMRDFSDKRLASGVFLIDLLAAVEPRCVSRDLVTAGTTDEDKQLNAKYAISSARKLGCTLFCTWEDLVDVKPKMVLSFVAAVMGFAHLGRPPTVRN